MHIDEKPVIVLKLGGHAMDKEELFEAFVEDVAVLADKGYKLVIVHGGGPHINSLMRSLNLKSNFVDGLRVTDEPALEAVEMALCAKVNKQIVRRLQKAGLRTAGLSGEDGNLLKASIKSPLLGKVGKITSVNPDILTLLLGKGYLPVIAPIALDENYEPLNINADTAAGAIAGALKADAFALLSDVAGVLDEKGNPLPKLDRKIIAELINADVITGGMLPKTECCLSALDGGCKAAMIIDGRQKNCLCNFIEGKGGAGTKITG